MMMALIFMKIEYGTMTKYEKALKIMSEAEEEETKKTDGKGSVIDILNINIGIRHLKGMQNQQFLIFISN